MKPSTAIKKALKLFGPNGERWCQGSNALDKKGKPVCSTSRSAHRFCINGALRRVCKDEWEVLYLARDAIRKSLTSGEYSIHYFNDGKGRRFASIRKVLRKAADLA